MNTDIEVLDVIKTYQAEYGFAPTIEELRQRLNVGSKRTVLRYLRALEKSSHIRRWAGARGIEVFDESQPKGLVAVHAIVGANCRNIRGDFGAAEEALRRLRTEYSATIEHNPNQANLNFHFVLFVEEKRGGG